MLWLNTYIFGIMKLQANYCSKIDRQYSQLYLNKKYNCLAPFRGFIWFMWRFVVSKAQNYLKGWVMNGICFSHFVLVTTASFDLAGSLGNALKVEKPASWREIFSQTAQVSKIQKKVKAAGKPKQNAAAVAKYLLRSKVKGGAGVRKISKRRLLKRKRNKLTKRLKKR